MVTMLTALMELKNVIVEEIAPNVDRDKAVLILTLNWGKLSDLLDTLKPLADCIGEIEKKDCSLGEGIKHILDYAKFLFGRDDNCNSGTGLDICLSEAKTEARKAFLCGAVPRKRRV